MADDFRKSEVLRAGSLLKMKTFDGRSLMDLFRSGESSDEHVKTLIIEAKAMENSYKKSGLSSSKAKSTSDWQSYLSIPGSIE
ncbi:repressor protein from prophage [mine drainage metagenome]|uniref:Repressor protein from prophage n=1 Tax=mine drainage metagenome TaxID=410659 RepID=T1CUP3_9ZZZZ